MSPAPLPVMDGVTSLDGLIRRAATTWPENTAWIFDLTGERLSFSDVDRRTRTLGQYLTRQGITPGDVVGVMADNTPEFPLAWLALARMGATTVPLNPKYGRVDSAHVLRTSGAKAVLASADYRDTFTDRPDDLSSLAIIDLTAAVSDTRDTPSPAETRDNTGAINSPANIQFTSGTTGKPKGCVLGHEYWLWITKTLVEDFPHLNDQDTVLTAQPFYYIDPQWNVTSCLYSGATLVVLDGFHPSTFWEQARSYEVTFFYCLGLMPTLLLKMPEHPHDTNHHVRAVVASAIPPSIHQALEERWQTPWFEAFGMTETGADIYVTPDIHDDTVASGALGFPRPHREAEVRRADGTLCDVGEIGQLFLRGPGMMREYFGLPEATAASLQDGWFSTGDLVSRDERGVLFFRGRQKDMIRRSGENIAAVEVEEAITAHPEVSSAAVMGLPDELRGEEVLAVIVPRSPERAHSKKDHAELIISVRDALARDLAPFKVPRFFAVVAELPRGASERIQKNQIDLDAIRQVMVDTMAEKNGGR